VTDSRVADTAALFDRSAAYYDRVNTVICLGADLRWRRWAAQRALATVLARKPIARGPGMSLAPRVLDASGAPDSSPSSSRGAAPASRWRTSAPG